MIRVDDMHAVAEAPAFLLLPASMPYSATPLDVVRGFALYHSPRPELHTLRLARHEPMSLSRAEIPTAHYRSLSETWIQCDRQTLGCRQRLLPYLRRQEARRNGRRRAVPVPITTEWEVRVFVPRGVDETTIEMAVRDRAVVVMRSWRHGDAVTWARRAYNLRMKRERKRGTK